MFSVTLLRVCLSTSLLTGTGLAVNIATVPVSDPGNPADTRYADVWTPQGYGRVDYTYYVAKFEVTTGQYCAFLNAVAAVDTYGLYNTYMGYSPNPGWSGCNIQRTGSPGSYSYAVPGDWANRPVSTVSWGDAARFCNWLSNGQPTGPQGPATTENGSYYLNGAATDTALSVVARRSDARYVIPTENEWYKAAYYDPDKPGGAGYWDYPTRTNTVPSNILDPNGTNNANSANGGLTLGPPYFRTEVGAFAGSPSAYGTFDQGGNVSEWTETRYHGAGQYRVFRGGFCRNTPLDMGASSQDGSQTSIESAWFGFRVAYIPEPTAFCLVASAGAVAVLRHRNRNRRESLALARAGLGIMAAASPKGE